MSGSTARRVSAAPSLGTSAMVSPVAGFRTGKVAPESASTQEPADVRLPAQELALDGSHCERR